MHDTPTTPSNAVSSWRGTHHQQQEARIKPNQCLQAAALASAKPRWPYNALRRDQPTPSSKRPFSTRFSREPESITGTQRHDQ